MPFLLLTNKVYMIHEIIIFGMLYRITITQFFYIFKYVFVGSYKIPMAINLKL